MFDDVVAAVFGGLLLMLVVLFVAPLAMASRSEPGPLSAAEVTVAGAAHAYLMAANLSAYGYVGLTVGAAAWCCRNRGRNTRTVVPSPARDDRST